MSERGKRWTGKLTAARLTPLAAAVAVYLLATLFTDAHFMADTADYVDSVAAYERGVNYDFWEFGHLFWRPIGWLCFKVQSLFTGAQGEAEARAQIVWTLLVINWLAGLVAVVCLYNLVKVVSKREWAAALAAAAFIFSHGFLNYAQTGSSYAPGLALLTLGLWLLARAGERGDDSWRAAA
ncbi:MAG TPA: glycosyltransferase family 39 protein, partial [Pyrinomonadaceae bacterium]|nr:glycosyltransferase family 39 protein [Pyrinomonadaceae bacterium]